MKHRERNITSLLFILLLVSICTIHNLQTHTDRSVTSPTQFNRRFCQPQDWSGQTPARRLLCGVGIYLNRDNQTSLQFLPGIGPKRAHDIIQFRKQHGPFRVIEDLQKISGIGPATVTQLTPWIEDVPSAADVNSAQDKSGKND